MTLDPDMLGVVAYLWRFGYLNGIVAGAAPGKAPDWRAVLAAPEEAVARALDAFEGWNNLPPRQRQAGTAIVASDEAVAVMSMPRCAVPEFSGMAESKWQAPATLRYWDNIEIAGMTPARTRDLVDQAWSQWAKVCGIKGTRVLDPKQANIVATARYIDGPTGTLGYAYFPTTGSPTEQREQVFDSADAGYFLDHDGLNFVNCYNHELGHSLGFQHGPGGQCNMSPFLVPQYWKPQDTYDIPTAVSLYGAALPADPIPEPPPPVDPHYPTFSGSGIY